MRNNVNVGRGCIVRSVAPKGPTIDAKREAANNTAAAAAAARYREAMIAKGLIKPTAA